MSQPVFDTVKSYDENGDKSVIFNYIKSLNNKKCSFIVIDDDLAEDGESFLRNLNGHNDVYLFVFNNWTEENNDKNNSLLMACNSYDGHCIVHTRSKGLRGIDFKLKKTPHVILIKDPESIQEME